MSKSMLALQVSCLESSLARTHDMPDKKVSLSDVRKAAILDRLDPEVGMSYEDITADIDMPYDVAKRLMGELAKDRQVVRVTKTIVLWKRKKS